MDINLPEPHAELSAAFALYEDALVHNKIDVLDTLFWASPHTVRYGVAENLHGIEAIRAFRNARPAQGLMRALQHTVITTFGRDFGTAMTEFQREGSSKSGRQSQTWCRIGGHWVVVAAHVSRNRTTTRHQVFSQLNKLIAQPHAHHTHAQTEYALQMFVSFARDFYVADFLERQHVSEEGGGAVCVTDGKADAVYSFNLRRLRQAFSKQ